MRRFGSHNNNHQVDEENPYWISFSDIMAGLLVIFILAAVALILELTQKRLQWDETIAELAEAEQVRKDILREVAEELNEKNIPVYISDNDTVLRIPEKVLTFKQGSFTIPSENEYRKNVLEIGNVLYQKITKDNRWEKLDTIFVEGHTDRIPYRNDEIKGNWGLSAFRAISLWDFWRYRMPKEALLKDLKNHSGKKLFSVSGYAATRPIPCSNSDPDVLNVTLCPNGPIAEAQSLAKNRRIDIRFTVKRPKLENYIAKDKELK